MRNEVENEFGVVIHTNTVRNRLHDIGLNGRIARKKPYVNKINREKRIDDAKKIMEKPFDYSKNVLCGFMNLNLTPFFNSDSKGYCMEIGQGGV